MRSVIKSLFFIFVTLAVFGQTDPVASPPTIAAEWKPPAPREKAKTPFAPKPSAGNNIFKGEAEKWLADAVTGLEGISLERSVDADVTDYISRLGQNLVVSSTVPSKSFEFIVLKDKRPDAFTVGAGKVYITIGMLKLVESEDELAGVIAHEIGHDAFGHAAKTATRQLFWMKGVRKIASADDAKTAIKSLYAAYAKNKFASFGEHLLGWGRADELQADKAAFYNVYKAGYNPRAMNDFFRRDNDRKKAILGSEYTLYQILSFLIGSHPPSGQRILAIKWESNWVKMPAKDVRYKNAAFDAMKAKVAGM